VHARAVRFTPARNVGEGPLPTPPRCPVPVDDLLAVVHSGPRPDRPQQINPIALGFRGTSLGSLGRRPLHLKRSTKRSSELRQSRKNSAALFSRAPIVRVAGRSAKNRASECARFPLERSTSPPSSSNAHACAARAQRPKPPFAPRKCVRSLLFEPSPSDGPSPRSGFQAPATGRHHKALRVNPGGRRTQSVEPLGHLWYHQFAVPEAGLKD
jgi:hypothetical protein